MRRLKSYGYDCKDKKIMNTKLTNTILSAVLFLGAAAAVNAQDKTTLDLLVSKGVITRAEADKIGKSSVAITPKEKTTKSIKLIGRVQTQYENINVDEYSAGTSKSWWEARR